MEWLPLSNVSIQIRYKMIGKLLFLLVIHGDHSKQVLICAPGHLPSGCLFKILALSVLILFLTPAASLHSIPGAILMCSL